MPLFIIPLAPPGVCKRRIVQETNTPDSIEIPGSLICLVYIVMAHLTKFNISSKRTTCISCYYDVLRRRGNWTCDPWAISLTPNQQVTNMLPRLLTQLVAYRCQSTSSTYALVLNKLTAVKFHQLILRASPRLQVQCTIVFGNNF